MAVTAAETAPPRAASVGSEGPSAPPALHERVVSDATVTRADGAMSSDRPAGHSVLTAQVAFLHRATPGMNWATAAVCLLLGVWWRHSGLGDALAPWLMLGAVSVLLRLYLQFGNRQAAAAGLSPHQARRFLALTVIAALAAGLMWGWGWISAVPRATPEMREIFLVIQVVMLLWSLFALRPYLPALLVFVAASLGPAFAWTTGLYGAGSGVPGTTLGLLILALTVVGFAVRFAHEFRAALLLQERVQGLLDEVTAKRDEAVRATLAKSRFLASVSHDLRQPMYAMNLYLSTVATHFDRLLASPGDGTSVRGVQDGIRRLQNSIVYLNLMFESLLDISRLNAGRVDAQIRHTTLRGLLEHLQSDFCRQAASQGLRFEMRLPPQMALMEVETDPALLERLLRNLLVNACRYTRSGGIRLSVVAKDRSLDFRVVDTGPGIARTMRARVFDEFFQVPDTEPNASAPDSPPRWGAPGAAEPADADGAGASLGGRGIGLGLSISARLADKLGSRIRLHSRVGRGSVFAFRQPMRISLRPKGEERPSAIGGDAPLPQALFVAVIDDDREIRHATRQLLEALGVEVFTAQSGQQAAERLGQLGRMPDLLLCDYRMGSENGIEAIMMLREEFNHDIPALLITGDTSPDRLEEFARMGLAVLYKPVSAPELLAAMREQLKREDAAPV